MGGGLPRTEAIVEAVADREGCEATELDPPLYGVIDPDALERLFEPADRPEGRVTFPYNGYRVVVTADGDVAVER